MSKVIDFKTPAQLRDDLAAALTENAALKTEVANLGAVKEMLILQILDLKDQLGGQISALELTRNNLDSLLKKLSG